MSQRNNELYEFGRFRLDVSERTLWRDGSRVSVADKAFETLCMLVRRGNRLVGKDELLNGVWADTIVEENNLDKSISLLRQILGERAGDGKFIETVRGHGYRFVADVRTVSAEVGGGSAAPSAVAAERQGEGQATPAIDPLPGTNTDETGVEPPGRKWPPGLRKAGPQFVIAACSLLLLGAVASYFWRESARPSASGQILSVAVLPFNALLAGTRDEALQMGMTDTLISKLGGSEEVIVRPLSAVRRYTALDRDAATAGRELNAEAVLDGSIQTSGDRIRASVRLIRTEDGKQLWAGSFDEKFTGIFAVQDSISERVAAALKIRLANREKKRPTENVEAYQLYMKGRFYLLKGVKPDTQTSVAYFQQAIAADSNYALAYTGLADAYRGLTVGGEMASSEVMPKAKAMAKKAIELDDRLAEAHANLGHLHFWYDWDWKAAENRHKRALELDPNSPDTLQFYAHLLSALGRHAEALEKIKRARELDPLNLRVNAIEGMLLTYAGQSDAAIAKMQKTLELEPSHRLALMMAARAQIERGKFAEAIAATSKARDVSPASTEPIAYGTYALAKSGKRAQAQAGLDELLKFSSTRYVPPYNIALVYNALGESEQALAHLEKAFAEKDVRMVWLKVEPKWNNLRNEVRFIELMKRMKFE